MKTSVLNSLKIKENIKNFDKIDFGCDWLTLSYTKSVDFFDNLLFWVDTDNSSFWTVEIDNHVFTYNKIVSQNWFWLTFICDYNWIATPLFQYVRFNKDTRKLFHKSAKITIYWSYFRLESIWEFTYHWITNFIWNLSQEDPDITRFDYRVDYFSLNKLIPIPSIESICWYVHSKSTTIEWKQWNNLVDWSVWNSKTWRYKVRYYDKKIDTNNKNKRFLYTDFLDYKSVHRLEIEFWRSFCRWFSLSMLNELEFKIIQVLGIDWKIYDSSIFYQYNSEFEITLDNANRFIDRFVNLSNKLYKAWFNPYLLIEEMIDNYYWHDFSKWLLDDFISKSKILWSLSKI